MQELSGSGLMLGRAVLGVPGMERVVMVGLEVRGKVVIIGLNAT